MATRVTRLRLNNNYNDDDGNNTLTAGGAGGSFDGAIKKEGSHSYKNNGTGYATKASFAGITTGNADRSGGGWLYVPSSFGSPSVFAIGPAVASQAWQLRSNSSTQVLIDLYADQKSFTTAARSLSTWYHYWGTYQASIKTSRAYIDKVESSSGAQVHANDSILTTGKFNLARDFDNTIDSPNHWDDIQIFNGVTSAAELANIYNETKAGILLMMAMQAKTNRDFNPAMFNGLLENKWVYNNGVYTRPSLDINKLAHKANMLGYIYK